jgi:hypothetical protein
MNATANHFVGVWQGEHHSRFAKITINLESAGADSNPCRLESLKQGRKLTGRRRRY